MTSIETLEKLREKLEAHNVAGWDSEDVKREFLDVVDEYIAAERERLADAGETMATDEPWDAIDEALAVLVDAAKRLEKLDPSYGMYLMAKDELTSVFDWAFEHGGGKPEPAKPEPGDVPNVCGNCIHGKSTSIDDTRCYKSTPYLPTGRHCRACSEWEPCVVHENPRAAEVRAAIGDGK